MRGDYSVGAAVVKFVENGFGNGAARSGLRSAAEFVYEDKCLGIGHLKHGLHVREEGTVGGEVVFQGLVVSDGHHNPVEYRQFRRF